jgi:hypothetical protein
VRRRVTVYGAEAAVAACGRYGGRGCWWPHLAAVADVPAAVAACGRFGGRECWRPLLRLWLPVMFVTAVANDSF